MSAFSALDPKARVAILLAAGVAIAGGSYLGWQMTHHAPEPVVADASATRPSLTKTSPSEATATSAGTEPTPEAAPETVPEATAAAPESAPKPDVEISVEPTAASADAPRTSAETPERPVQPVIDTWRVSAEGEAVVSGKTVPESRIDVVVDDKTVASGTATGSGDFAILFTLAPNPKPSLMWLSMTQKDQTPVLSEEMVALGPIAGPQIAAEPAAETVVAADAPEAPPALLLSGEGAVVLQDPASPASPPDDPAKAAVVMIDTIAYSPEGEVQVGGRGAGGATLRLYLDNAEKAVAEVPANGLWVTTLPDTAPGIYTLRVDQLDADGKVSSRFETPFKRETLEALAAASAPEPAPQETAAAEAPAQPQATAPVEPTAQPAAATDVAAAQPVPAETEAAATEPAPMETPAAEPAATAEPVASQSAPEPAPAPITVTVQPGFTLWGIAQDRMGDGVMYVQVFEANKDKIKDPDLIYPGQVFTMPEATSP